ncbi:MAG: hypothetical protein KTR32_11785 [Granulosicoccus sp.]|nr:hypothetical protein [Granulosicoccus sp.]
MDSVIPRTLLILWAAALAGCSAGNLPTDTTPASESSITSALNDAPGFLHDPDIALIVTPVSSQITVAYADANLQQRVNAEYVSDEWEKMKLCLDVSAQPPVVLVIDGWIDASAGDDVLFNITGRRLATSTHRTDSTNLIQISTYDFDGSQGNPGFHLRSILGRYLWSVNQLPAVGYNTGCASHT